MSLPEFCKVFLYSQSEHLKKNPNSYKKMQKSKAPTCHRPLFFFLKCIVGFGWLVLVFNQIWEDTRQGLGQKRKHTMRWRRIQVGLMDKPRYYHAPRETPALGFIQPPVASGLRVIWRESALDRL